ncbi:MAG TPA: tetratricopeptide repeat protein [Blastocatellia bacterium]|jgi:tetratricopeptide (TPR) repeat protein|nr:tetratricopeptide repeat protein [Blastocatellia bacterium]
MITSRHAAVASVLVLASALSALAQDWDRAVSLYNQKQYRQAIREFHAVLKANPDAWQSWYYIGASHYQLQSYEDSIDASQNYLKAAEKDDKVQQAGSFFIGMSNYQMKQYEKAIPALARYIALSDKIQQKIEPSARAALGRCYIFTNRFSEAIPVLTASAAELKTNANNYYYIGLAQRKLGRDDQAITALNQALAIDPKDADSLALLTSIYFSQLKQNPAVVKQLISVGERLVAVRNDEYAWGVLGQAYLIDKQYAKAAPLLDKFARAHADSSGAWYNLGLAHSQSSQWKPAAEALEQAVKLAPTGLAALLELAYVYESDKQYDKAMSAYERAYEASGRKDQTAKAGIDRIKQSKP